MDLAAPGGRLVTAVGVLAVVVGALLFAVGRALPRPLWHVVVGSGTALVALVVWACPDTTSAVALSAVFTFIAIDAFFFFPPRQAVVQLLALVVASVTSLLSHDDVGVGIAVAEVVVFTCIAVVVGGLVQTASAATRDPLTGLVNRRGFDSAYEDLLVAAERTGAPLSVALVDVDDFKAVNDGLGHAAGDELLARIATVCRTTLPAPVVVARYGGDEFVVLLPATSGPEALARLELLRTRVDGVTLSCGVAQLGAGESGAELLRRADTAMYAAKRGGRDRCALADAGSPALARDLAEALRTGAVHVALQPIVRVDDEQVVGVEALARWTDPVRGAVSPAEFIPVAEAAGLIEELGAVVLRQACHDALALSDAWGLPLTLTVNASGRQLVAPGFAGQVLSVLDAAGWPTASLVLEVTESLIDASSAAALEALRELRGAGVAVAIDDFGTGYSSLSRLDTVPADIVKLDSLFIASIATSARRASVLRTVLDLCSSLGLVVIAEGVEDRDQAHLLQQLGCPLAQGYLYDRPQPLATLLRRGPRAAVTPAHDGPHRLAGDRIVAALFPGARTPAVAATARPALAAGETAAPLP
nr:bifunctional diguanylate cyclase/phosphodiesterase [Kineococcus siccus]